MIETDDPIDSPVTFVDVDENPLRVWLRPDRVQLHVIDCRPGLEAGELRRFAALLFSTYVGGALTARLAAARAALVAAGAPTAGQAELAAALAALDAVAGALAPGDDPPAPDPEPPRSPVPHSYLLAGRRARAARGNRAGEPPARSMR